MHQRKIPLCLHVSHDERKDSPLKSPTSSELPLVPETPSNTQLLVTGILNTKCLMCPTDAHVNASQSSESTSITLPVVVKNTHTFNDDQAAHEEMERDSVTHEPNIPNNIEILQAGTSANRAMQEIAQLCQQSNAKNNRVEVLRVLLSRMVTGRQLDISDPSQTVQGKTNQIFETAPIFRKLDFVK